MQWFVNKLHSGEEKLWFYAITGFEDRNNMQSLLKTTLYKKPTHWTIFRFQTRHPLSTKKGIIKFCSRSEKGEIVKLETDLCVNEFPEMIFNSS